MLKLAWPKYNGLLMLSLLMLAGCVTDQTPPPVASAGDLIKQRTVEPLACTDFVPMRFQPGMDDVTPKDVQDAMTAHPSDPIAWVRGLVGDTSSTRDQIARYQAKRRAIGCKTY